MQTVVKTGTPRPWAALTLWLFSGADFASCMQLSLLAFVSCWLLFLRSPLWFYSQVPTSHSPIMATFQGFCPVTNCCMASQDFLQNIGGRHHNLELLHSAHLQNHHYMNAKKMYCQQELHLGWLEPWLLPQSTLMENIWSLWRFRLLTLKVVY